jgi:D-alanyl-D-alanine carboxypeptidase (penicillin-binding protein 5/6)
MNSPLQGGTMRRSRVRRGRVLLPVLALAIAGVAAWLLLADGTTDSAPPAAVVNGPPALKHRAEKIAPSKDAPPPGIDLFAAKPLRVHFKHPPRAGLVFDLRSGQVVWARNPLKRLPIASLTKIMTAILVVESAGPRERARITHEALSYEGSGVGVLPKHKRVPVEGLLAGMLLPSGNDAALALADHVAGTDRRFVRLMNRRAKAMGLGCTHYASADGIEDRNVSCAADLAALARTAMAKRRIARIVARRQMHIRFPIKSGHLWLNSTNPLLRLRYPGTIGLKTGSTDKAGHCLVAIVRRGSRTYAAVLLHSPDSGRQAKKLLDAAFKLRT